MFRRAGGRAAPGLRRIITYESTPPKKPYHLRIHPPKKAKGLEIHPSKKAECRSLKAPQSVIHIKHHISLRQYKYWILSLDSFREAYQQNLAPDADGFYQYPSSG